MASLASEILQPPSSRATQSQLEYYEQITKDMPGKVLAKHGIVERDGKDYRLSY